MKIATTVLAGAATLATAAAVGLAGAPAASASNPITQPFGTQEQLTDVNGALVTGYTVSNLKPSTDVIPYRVQGTLWEATANVQAVRGTVTPIVADFNARAASGQDYRELATVPSAQGVNPAPLGQGAQTTGKLYFDVVGPPPNSVVYNDGVQDVLLWVGGTPAASPNNGPVNGR